MTEEEKIHEHVFEDRWYPYNRTEIWRKCVIPGCLYFEKKKAKA